MTAQTPAPSILAARPVDTSGSLVRTFVAVAVQVATRRQRSAQACGRAT